MDAVLNPLKLGIPRCTGDPSEVELLISEINRQKQVYNWDDARVRQYFYLSLLGKAQIWWEQNEDELNVKNWEDLKNSFRERFHPSPGTTSWTRFQERCQNPGEDAMTYFEDKNRLKKLTNIPLADPDAVNFFLEGLEPELRFQVELRGNNDTLVALRENIRQIEIILKQKAGGDSSRLDKIEAMMLNLQRDLDSFLKINFESQNKGIEQLLFAMLEKFDKISSTPQTTEITQPKLPPAIVDPVVPTFEKIRVKVKSHFDRGKVAKNR